MDISKNKNKNNNIVLQSSSPLPKQVKSVCGMSVYENDRLSWLKQSVDSILNQSVPPCLFVIAIDGIVDDDISKYLSSIESKNSFVVLFHLQSNSGLSTCMNLIIDWVTQFQPKYFFRMDADDISLPHRFQKQIKLLDDHPKVDILGSALREINEKSKVVGVRVLPLKHSALIRSLSRRCPINHPTVAFRFRIFEDGYRYREDKLNTQDYFFWITLAKAGFHFANVREPLLLFRRVNGFYKRRGFNKSINEFRARLFAMEQLNQHKIKNYCYAFLILGLRMMPSFILKAAYKADRLFLKNFHK